MKIILTHDVHNLGEAGDIKTVAPGYARNYLIPKGLAVKATPGAIKEYERNQAVEARREERLAARAEALVQRLSGVTLDFEAKASDKGRLFGSITTADIVEALNREVGEKFDRRKHIVSEPIREVGEHTVSVRLTPEITVEIKALVKPEGGELPEPTPEEEAPAAEEAISVDDQDQAEEA